MAAGSRSTPQELVLVVCVPKMLGGSCGLVSVRAVCRLPHNA